MLTMMINRLCCTICVGRKLVSCINTKCGMCFDADCCPLIVIFPLHDATKQGKVNSVVIDATMCLLIAVCHRQ